jgi:hypothetical protein
VENVHNCFGFHKRVFRDLYIIAVDVTVNVVSVLTVDPHKGLLSKWRAVCLCEMLFVASNDGVFEGFPGVDDFDLVEEDCCAGDWMKVGLGRDDLDFR